MIKTLNNGGKQLFFERFSLEKQGTPFVKWAGGKSQLLPEIRIRIPTNFSRYIEPFLGGGAVFFDIAPREAILSDTNDELINCYQVVRDLPDELLKIISNFKISKSEFYRIRALDPVNLSKVERAARFIYLNKTCFNGLYRVNKKGQFNVPFGNVEKCTVVNPDNVYNASYALRSTEIVAKDYFILLTEKVRKDDFVYIDPPYFPVDKYSDFKRYTKEFFYEEDHNRLADLCHELDMRGCKFMVSNSYHSHILALYSKFRIELVKANRFINCIGTRRGKINEVIIRNY